MHLQSLSSSSMRNTPQRGEQVQAHVHKPELRADTRAWAGQSCCSQGMGTQWGGRSLVCSKSPFATLIYQVSVFIHANGAERNTNVKAEELTWNGAHSFHALPSPHETYLVVIWLKAGFPPKLYFQSRSQQWQHQDAIWAWNWKAVR